jgi:beta-lactam-binding protein with PASTA domain
MTGVAPDQVVGQSPPPNASGVSAPRISLLVASPPDAPAFVMPNFIGQSLADATGALQAAGMKLGAVTVRGSSPDQNQPTSPDTTPATPQPQTTTPAPDSLILSQTPPAGQKIAAGSLVNFEVSK